MSIVELLRIDRPVSLFGVAEDGAAYAFDSLGERRDIVRLLDDCFRFGHSSDDLVGHVIDETHEEVPRAHGGVTDF